MTRVQRTLDQQLAELQAQRARLDARAKALAERKKTRDLRSRAKAEKLLLQLVLRRLDAEPAFRAAVLGQLDAAALKPEERAALLALLTAPAAPCSAAEKKASAAGADIALREAQP